MNLDFTYDSNPSRILFGAGTLAVVSDEIGRLGAHRALILCTPFQRLDAEKLATQIGSLAAGIFSEATMHTPVSVTQKAMSAFEAAGADCIVSLGGGSTIGLGKAIALRNDAKQIVVPTTYAGSEVTPILGETENGIKTTVRNLKVLPEVVIYDPSLSLGLPVEMSVTSGLNAMAHAVEALYARDKNPVSSLMAVEGIRALHRALPVIISDPGNVSARSQALYGSWLCGTVLGAVGMSLHHKLCHTLGGSLDLPHAQTHAIMLPHSAAYNSTAAERELDPVAEIFGGSIGEGLYNFSRSLGAPLALRDLGVEERQLDHVADLALQNAYWNPRPLDRPAIRSLLQRAWEGVRPE